jgi:hypothetical protein
LVELVAIGPNDDVCSVGQVASADIDDVVVENGLDDESFALDGALSREDSPLFIGSVVGLTDVQTGSLAGVVVGEFEGASVLDVDDGVAALVVSDEPPLLVGSVVELPKNELVVLLGVAAAVQSEGGVLCAHDFISLVGYGHEDLIIGDI